MTEIEYIKELYVKTDTDEQIPSVYAITEVLQSFVEEKSAKKLALRIICPRAKRKRDEEGVLVYNTHSKYYNKVLKNLPLETVVGHKLIVDEETGETKLTQETYSMEKVSQLANAIAIYQVLREHAKNDAAENEAARLARYELDRFLFLDKYNVQIVNRIKWIKRREAFIPNFKDLVDFESNEHVLEGEIINKASIIRLMHELILKVGMSTGMTENKKRSVIGAAKNLIHVLKHITDDGEARYLSMPYTAALQSARLYVRGTPISEWHKGAIIRAINLVLSRLKFIK